MKKIFLIAHREFMATVATRAFIIGLFILPATIALFALIGPRLFSARNYRVQGEIAVIDPTGRIMPELQRIYDPDRIEMRRKEEAAGVLDRTPKEIQELARNSYGNIGNILSQPPDLRVLNRPLDSNIEQEKKWLITQPKAMPHLALIVIHSNAVEPAGTGMKYGAYDIYVPPSLDDRAAGEIQRGLREAIINARLQARAIDKSTIDAIVSVPQVRSVTVTQTEQRRTVRGFNTLLPAAFGVLLLMGVWGGGGQLLTTMVEEKSSRIVEVLLSSVSPVELMTGKLLGQMAVGLIGMSFYLAMGIALLASFALMGLLDFSLIIYLLIFFVITYLVQGSFLMAIGAAVNDMKEAQGLMTPLSAIFMLPWILWIPISRDPESVLSIAMSFTPPVNAFAMLLRMASNSPPPFWQVWLSIAIGLGSVYCALWFTAKIFRIGILMYGKAPNFATLIRWARAS